jgi:hypothetical protein
LKEAPRESTRSEKYCPTPSQKPPVGIAPPDQNLHHPANSLSEPSSSDTHTGEAVTGLYAQFLQLSSISRFVCWNFLHRFHHDQGLGLGCSMAATHAVPPRLAIVQERTPGHSTFMQPNPSFSSGGRCGSGDEIERMGSRTCIHASILTRPHASPTFRGGSSRGDWRHP